MTREEIKDMLPTLQAYAKGEVIEWQDENGEWQPISDISLLVTSSKHSENYRIKPEPKYRPFNSKEECWNEMLKHKPFGWVIDKEDNDHFNLNSAGETGVGGYTYREAFDEIVFADGSPFGIKEE